MKIFLQRFLSCLLAVSAVASTFVPDALFADCGGAPCPLIYRGAVTQPTALSPDGTWVKELELADFDADGWLDLLMLQKQPLFEWLDGTLRIQPQSTRDLLYLSRGDVLGGLNLALDAPLPDVFARKANAFPVNYQTTRSYDAAVADFDGDGNLDIVRPDTPGILDVLWGDGTGRFPAVTDVFAQIGGDPNAACNVGFVFPPNAGGNYDSVAVGDCHGDGDLDFVLAQYFYDCGESIFLFNQGSRTFSFTSMPALEAKNTHSVSLADANGDGHLDVLLDHGSGFDPELYLGLGAGCAYQASSKVTFSALGNDQATTVGDIVELTGDGNPDVYFGKGLDGGDAGLYVNTGSPGAPYGSIVRCSGTCSSAGKYDVRYLDLDADGTMEAVTANINVNENCSVAANGNCQPGNPSLPIETSFIEDTALHVFRFTATGFTDVTAEFLDPSYATGNRGGIAVANGDLDNDGDLDVVLGGVVGQPGDTDAFGAAHIYENRHLTLLQNRTLDSGQTDLLAINTLTTAEGTLVTGSAQVTLEAGVRVVLTDGFRASPGSGGKLVARLLP